MARKDRLKDEDVMGDFEPLHAVLRAKKRPGLRDLTPEFVYAAGKCFVTQEEIAELFGVSQPAVSKRLAKPELREAWLAGRAGGRMSLRRSQFRAAVIDGGAVPQIWLGKNELGQRDSVKEIEQKTDVQVTYIARWGGAGGELPAAEEEYVIEGEVSEEEE